MNRMVRWAVLGFVALGASKPAVPVAQESVDSLFEAYRAGRYDAVWAQLSRIEDWEELRDAIRAREGVWPAEARAAFTLEAAIVAQLDFVSRYGPEVGLFKDACRMVRALPSGGAFEAAWHDAAIAAMAAPYVIDIDLRDHLDHIRSRIDEGTRALAAARQDEQHGWHFLRDVLPGTNDLDDGRVRQGRVTIRRALDHLERASGFERTRAEAVLRRGALLAAWQASDEALEALLSVPSLTADSRLRYLALVHAGRLLVTRNETARAGALLRQAVALQPDGREGLLLLASLEFGANRRQEADRLTRRAMATPDAGNLWFEFFENEWPALGGRLAALREALR